ncbi:hypothetical protein [Xenorhabdus sp. SGI246]
MKIELSEKLLLGLLGKRLYEMENTDVISKAGPELISAQRTIISIIVP